MALHEEPDKLVRTSIFMKNSQKAAIEKEIEFDSKATKGTFIRKAIDEKINFPLRRYERLSYCVAYQIHTVNCPRYPKIPISLFDDRTCERCFNQRVEKKDA